MQARENGDDSEKAGEAGDERLRRSGLIHLVVEAGHAINENVGINLRERGR